MERFDNGLVLGFILATIMWVLLTCAHTPNPCASDETGCASVMD